MAREEFLHEVRHYTEISRGLGERIDRAVQAAEVQAAQFPDLHSPFLHGTRRVLLKKFKFSLVYLTHEQETYVVAVAPFRKKPGYWKKRLDAG